MDKTELLGLQNKCTLISNKLNIIIIKTKHLRNKINKNVTHKKN